MQKKFKKLICGMLVATTVLSTVGCSSVVKAEEVSEIEDREFSKIVAFGDSYSDNGSANAVSTAILESDNNEGAFVKPGELYFENRYSNGKTAIEVAAELANLPLENYATGGGTSGYENYSDWMDRLGGTGVLGQIDKFEATLKEGEADDDALYFILAGANDYCKFIDFNLEGTVEDVANQVVKNIETAIRELADLGAEQFLVSHAIDVSTMPYEVTEGRKESAKVFSQTVSAQLPALLEKLSEELDIEIGEYDITKTTDEIMANPEKYGFKEVVEVIQPTWPKVLPAKENVEDYMFFDEWHPSATTHKIVGQAIYEVIQTME